MDQIRQPVLNIIKKEFKKNKKTLRTNKLVPVQMSDCIHGFYKTHFSHKL